MVDKVKRPFVFERGSTWLRSDFHLHTKADKEFQLFRRRKLLFF